jgi:hypothetical protein
MRNYALVAGPPSPKDVPPVAVKITPFETLRIRLLPWWARSREGRRLATALRRQQLCQLGSPPTEIAAGRFVRHRGRLPQGRGASHDHRGPADPGHVRRFQAGLRLEDLGGRKQRRCGHRERVVQPRLKRTAEGQDYVVGFEYQLLDNQNNPDAARGGALHQAGVLYDVQSSRDATKPVDEFNYSRLVVRGDHVEPCGTLEERGKGDGYESQIARSSRRHWRSAGRPRRSAICSSTSHRQRCPISRRTVAITLGSKIFKIREMRSYDDRKVGVTARPLANARGSDPSHDPKAAIFHAGAVEIPICPK